MLEHNKENDELVRQYRDLVDKADKATDKEEKERYAKLKEEKFNEMLIREFGDRNFKRFNS